MRTYVRMTNTSASTAPPQGDMMQHGDIVPNNSSLANDNARRVVNHDTTPYLGTWMNINLHCIGNAALHHHGQRLHHT